MTRTATTTLPIDHLLSNKNQRPVHFPSYFIIFQHSLRLELRLTSATPNKSSDLYKSAGVTEPQVASQRDISGFLVLKEIISTLRHGNESIVFVTTGALCFEMDGVKIVDLGRDPLGWEGGFSLNDLEGLMQKIEQMSTSQRPVPLVFDSLAPIIEAHGIEQTITLLACLRRTGKFSSVIAAVLQEMLHPHDHRLLEDSSDAIITLEDGMMQIVGKSHRGTGKVTKEIQPFRIISDEKGSRVVFHVQINDKLEDKANSLGTEKKVTDGHIDLLSKRGTNRITLKHEEGERNFSAERKGPRIFLQDDDPEFDDLDEEDPDDDLDI